MSGGSFNYLCFVDADRIGERIKDLERMEMRLMELDCPEASGATGAILVMLKALQVQIDRLSGVWQAVEWIDSGDYSEGQIEKANEEFLKRN